MNALRAHTSDSDSSRRAVLPVQQQQRRTETAGQALLRVSVRFPPPIGTEAAATATTAAKLRSVALDESTTTTTFLFRI